MNISPEEAIALLETWRAKETPLRIHLSGRQGDFQGVIGQIAGTVITVVAGPEELKLDVRGAEFNGDSRETLSDRGAYLVCELPNGDRYSLRTFSRSS
jgi:hypothetical protein